MEKLLEILQKAVKLEKEYDNYLKQGEIIKELRNKISDNEKHNRYIMSMNRKLSFILESQYNIKICNECGGEGGYETGPEGQGEQCPKCLGKGYIKLD